MKFEGRENKSSYVPYASTSVSTSVMMLPNKDRNVRWQFQWQTKPSTQLSWMSNGKKQSLEWKLHNKSADREKKYGYVLWQVCQPREHQMRSNPPGAWRSRSMARHLLDKNEQQRISFFLTMMQQANHILFISNKIHTLIFIMNYWYARLVSPPLESHLAVSSENNS